MKQWCDNCCLEIIRVCPLLVCKGGCWAAGRAAQSQGTREDCCSQAGCSMKALICWLGFAPQVLYELPTNTQWCFDIQWCPRNPAVLSAASFDGRISVYSIMGGSADGLRQKQVDQVLKIVQLRIGTERDGGNKIWQVFSGCLQPCLLEYHFSTNKCLIY